MNEISLNTTRRPAATTALHYLSVAEAASLIAAKELSPVELVEAHLARIDALNDKLCAYITVAAEAARAAARAAEKDIMAGRRRGPLHGIPYGLKDNYDTRGIRTTAASRLMWDNVPNGDATLHARLQEAGAILLGKHNTWEFGTGLGETQTDLPFPVARNPWNTDYFTGGSSSGTGASVGAGLAMFGLGSDTGGSVRVPAAAQGLCGLKPTYGRLSRAGILPNSFSLDAPGPLARTARDTALVMNVIAGVDPRDPTSVDHPVPDYTATLDKGVKGLRIGYFRRVQDRDFEGHKEVVAALDETARVLRDLGAEIVDLDLPHATQDHRLMIRLIGNAECLSIHERDFRERHQLMGKPLREKFMGALGISSLDYIKAVRWRREMTVATDAAMATCDAVLCAGPIVRLPRLDDEAGMKDFMIKSGTCIFNVTGHPAAAIPTGFDRDGLPTTIQIAGRYWDEGTVLRVAAAYEEATGWNRRHPNC